MNIYPLELIQLENRVRVQSRIELSNQSHLLWFELDHQYRPYLTTEKLDGFLVAVLLLAMKHGEDIQVHGELSEKLYHNLTYYYIPLITHTIQGMNPIQIHCEGLDDGSSYPCEKKVVTGFSAGVDSFSTIVEYWADPKIPSNYKITHLLLNNVGSHSDEGTEVASTLFNQRFEILSPFPREANLSFLKMDSNLSDVLQMDFQQTNTPRNVAPVLLLQKLFSKFYFSSSFPYNEIGVRFAPDTSFVDPIALPLLSTETLECLSTGASYTRVQKTKLVTTLEASRRYLNVCVDSNASGRNCSVCFKCARTLLTLEILGVQEQYRVIFDLQKYQQYRSRYLIRLLRNPKGIFEREIIALAKEKAFTFPFECYAMAELRNRIPNFFLQPAKAFKKLSRFKARPSEAVYS
jgi:hypothetical protein